LETYRLICHPDSPARKVRSVDAYVVHNRESYLHLRWRIKGSGLLVVPEFVGPGREDGLWQTTCFEMFVQPVGGESYAEFNVSPSGRWAAYDFAGYRDGMAERPMAPPPLSQQRRHAHILTFDTQLRSSTLPPRPWNLGLSAVIEEEGGHLSYWAIAHPEGAPDFHHPACFAATLPAPGSA
jgi:hypothetical protein